MNETYDQRLALTRYSGGLQDTSGPYYKVTFSGRAYPPPPQAAPYEPDFWMPSVSGTVALPFDSTSLPGSPFRFADTTWHWDLHAGVGQ